MPATRAPTWIWVVMGILALVAALLAIGGEPIVWKTYASDDVLRLLGAYAVIALVIERTLEVLISAWQGQRVEKLFSAAENAKRALLQAPANIIAQQTVAVAADQIIDHKAVIKGVALRAALVAGLLIAAIGMSTLGVFFDPPAEGANARFLYKIVDMVITAGMIGGGSDAIHKLMSTVTTYLDAATGNNRTRAAETLPISNVAVIPTLSPGPPG